MLFQGVLSNRRSQPVITEWFGLRTVGSGKWEILELNEVLRRTGLTAGLPNKAGEAAHLKEATKLLPQAVNEPASIRSNCVWSAGNLSRNGCVRISANCRTSMMRRWHESRCGSERTLREAARLAHEKHEVEGLYQQRSEWLTETFTAVNAPYLRVVAVFESI